MEKLRCNRRLARRSLLGFRAWIAETLGTNDIACILGLIRASEALQDFLWKNCGLNDEWPVEIKVATDVADEMTRLLEEHRLSLVPFKKHISVNAKPNSDYANG